jgi:hypothetical protein
MRDDHTKLDALLLKTAVRPPSVTAPDLRGAVLAEIASRRSLPIWQRIFIWFDETEPATLRPVLAVFALAASVVIGISVPAQLNHVANEKRATRALRLDSFALPAYPWGSEH